ncbi:hypothetical protein GOV08_00465 [Candidatus Woesearchaeota archaeon]|nr:hypothetical protein [Candidatus Woesearchaeota archaeon]
MGGEPTIQVTKDGPLLVNNVPNLFISKAKDNLDIETFEADRIEAPATFALCRCGRSNTKPFCDGTHVNKNFKPKVDEEWKKSVPDKYIVFKGKKVTIHDNRGVCSHRGFCTGLAPKVWRSKYPWGEEWVNPDGDTKENVITPIKLCPSGALKFEENNQMFDSIKREPSIIVLKDGPYNIVGNIKLLDEDGKEQDFGEHYALCRCGATKNSPRCNGWHYGAPWYEIKREDGSIEKKWDGSPNKDSIKIINRVEDFEKEVKK